VAWSRRSDDRQEAPDDQAIAVFDYLPKKASNKAAQPPKKKEFRN
jgi:hypothetical protein